MTSYPFTNVNVGDNWDQSFTGSGLGEDAASIVKSIETGDWVSIGGNVVAGVLDGLAYFDNPVKALGTSAIGWIIEHLTALDAFLDQTVGDPQAVQGAAETFYQAAKTLDDAAGRQIRAFGLEVPTYRSGQSPSAVAFEQRIGPRGDELKALSIQCHGLAESVNMAGVLVGTVRGIMRDLLAEFAYSLFQKGIVALAEAPYTNGFSIAFFTSDACRTGARLAVKLADKLKDLLESLKKLSQLVRRLSNIAHKLADPALRGFVVGVGKNYAPPATKAADDAVSLSSADAATQEVAEHEEAERKAKDQPPGPGPFVPESQHPPAEKPKQGPGLGVKWHTSGTLDE